MMMQDRILEILTESPVPLTYEQIAGTISRTQSLNSIKIYMQRLIVLGLAVGDKRLPARERPRLYTTPDKAHLLPVARQRAPRQQSWDGAIDPQQIAYASSIWAWANR